MAKRLFDSELARQAGKKSSRKGIPNTKTRLRRLLELENDIVNPVNGKTERFTVAEQMDLAMIIKARKGDIAAYNALIDRLEGKPKQAIDHGGDQANPIRMILDKYGSGDIDELPESTTGSSEDST